MPEHIVHILPEQVASQIAAGEVVERPASAVKELIENSLDAGARSVSVEILGGGSALIAVADDGSGMTRADAILSLRRHATSKISSAADLSAIRTLGFRGEALASIASVSHLRMQTRRAADEHGVEVAAEAGNIEDTRTCAMAAGTRIEVRRLFFNTPARLKFLKTIATEQGAIAEARAVPPGVRPQDRVPDACVRPRSPRHSRARTCRNQPGVVRHRQDDLHLRQRPLGSRSNVDSRS
jgi:DNA mismatch repair protein MutL